ncbi:GIY-YIG nuclease family protein [Candidatus Omnitrophota bacterium]
MKSGYLYVLVHPSDPNLVKIGRTTRKPEERLAMHNRDDKELTGQIVKETGQKWKLKEYIAVPDPAYAEKVFWEATGLESTLHRPSGIEVTHTEWERLQMALGEAKKAGIRPPPKFRTRPVRNREWMIKQLEGTGITMIGRYRGLITGVEFQCANGHVFKESAGVVAYGKSCPLCGLVASPDKQ